MLFRSVNIAGHTAGSPGSYQGLDDFGNQPGGRDAKIWGVPGLGAYHGQDINLTDALTLEVKKALGNAVGSGKPFYLYFAHYAVHLPIQPHKRFIDHYLGKKYPGTDIKIPKVEAEYASSMATVEAETMSAIETLDSEHESSVESIGTARIDGLADVNRR